MSVTRVTMHYFYPVVKWYFFALATNSPKPQRDQQMLTSAQNDPLPFQLEVGPSEREAWDAGTDWQSGIPCICPVGRRAIWADKSWFFFFFKYWSDRPITSRLRSPNTLLNNHSYPIISWNTSPLWLDAPVCSLLMGETLSDKDGEKT